MRFDQHVVVAHFAAALPQITNQLFTRLELGRCRLAPIEITDQTNAERDVVQIITMYVAPVDLTAPSVAHFDLTVPGRCPVADHEMISQTVLHVPHVFMIVIEYLGVALPRSAVVYNNKLPLWIAAIGRSAIEFRTHRARQVTITRTAPACPTAAVAMENAVPKAGPLFAGLFDGQLRRIVRV